MGGSTPQPISNNYMMKFQSQGLSEKTFSTFLQANKQNYEYFVNELVVKQPFRGNEMNPDQQPLYIQANSYYNIYKSRKQLKYQIEDYVFTSLRYYVDEIFCIALSKEILVKVKEVLKFNAVEIEMSQIYSCLVLGDYGQLFRVYFQAGVKHIDISDDDEDAGKISTIFFGIYLGLSAINIKEDYLAQKQLQLERFLETHNLELNQQLKRRFQEAYNSTLNKEIHTSFQEGATFDNLANIGWKVFDVLSIVGPIISNFRNKQQNTSHGKDTPSQGKDTKEKQEGQQIFDPQEIMNNMSETFQPQTNPNPYSIVGLITAQFTKGDSGQDKKSCKFTGTLINDLIIITSPRCLIDFSDMNKEYNLSSISIKFLKERQERKIEKKLINFENFSQDQYCFMYLEVPYQAQPQWQTRFIPTNVTRASYIQAVLSKKIYMCGYTSHDQVFKQQHQSSRALAIYKTHFIEGFKKNQLSIGAPIYFIDDDGNFRLIGVNHSSISFLKIFSEKYVNQNATKFATPFIRQPFYETSANEDYMLSHVRMRSSTTKNNIYSKHKFNNFQSLQDQLKKNRIEATSCIHNIVIIQQSNSFLTKYHLGVKIDSVVSKDPKVVALSNQFDRTFLTRIFQKKFVQSQEDPLSFDLTKAGRYNVYSIKEVQPVKGLTALIMLGLNNVDPNFKGILVISKENMQNLYPLSGFSISIQSSQNSMIQLKRTERRSHELLDLYDQTEKKQEKGLLFVTQKISERNNTTFEFFCGFQSDNKVLFLSSLENVENIESIPIENKRLIIESPNSQAPYSSIKIIITKFQVSDRTTFRVGTCSLVNGQKGLFLITCAHNVIYNQNKPIDASKEPQKSIRIVQSPNGGPIPWNFIKLKEIFDGAKPIIQKVQVHPSYLKQLTNKHALNRLRQQGFYDMAVITLKSKDSLFVPEKNFVIKQNQPSLIVIKEKIQISGYPAKEDLFGSKFGVCYTEMVEFHAQKNKKDCYQIHTQGKDRIIKHRLSTLSGNSGSPIFYKNSKGQYEIVGIHISGVSDKKGTPLFNLGSYVYQTEVMRWLRTIDGKITTK